MTFLLVVYGIMRKEEKNSIPKTVGVFENRYLRNINVSLVCSAKYLVHDL